MTTRRNHPPLASHKALTLNDVKAKVLTCVSCGLSQHCRSPIPISFKARHPRYLVVGEAPGRIEDRQGEPFVGPAGTFLRRSLRRAGLSPLDGAYLNAVSCWPSEQRTPQASEIDACRNNLHEQLAVMSPVHVLVCGSVALQALIPHATLTYAIGAPVNIHHKTLFAVYHPAYILRQRSALEGWERDLRIFRSLVDSPECLSWDDLNREHCLYCSSRRMPYDIVCHRHDKWLQQDSYVKPGKVVCPPEPTLF